LRKEEGRSPKNITCLFAPDKSEQPLIFAERLPLSPDILTKLGPAVERSGIHLGVWHDEDELYIWGTHILFRVFVLCWK